MKVEVNGFSRHNSSFTWFFFLLFQKPLKTSCEWHISNLKSYINSTSDWWAHYRVIFHFQGILLCIPYQHNINWNVRISQLKYYFVMEYLFFSLQFSKLFFVDGDWSLVNTVKYVCNWIFIECLIVSLQGNYSIVCYYSLSNFLKIILSIFFLDDVIHFSFIIDLFIYTSNFIHT